MISVAQTEIALRKYNRQTDFSRTFQTATVEISIGRIRDYIHYITAKHNNSAINECQAATGEQGSKLMLLSEKMNGHL